MNRYSTRIISDSGILVVAMMLSNALNFVFHAYLGRVLSFEEFGLLTLVNTFLFVASMFLGAFGTTINHKVAFLFGSRDYAGASQFFKKSQTRALLIVGMLTVVWVLFVGGISYVFRIADPIVLYTFSPVYILLVLLTAGRSYLQGTLTFGAVALIYLSESITKLVSAFILVSVGLSSFAYLSIPISIVFATLLCSFILFTRLFNQSSRHDRLDSDLTFPLSFYLGSLFNAVSTTAFLSVDVLLAKHFLNPVEAGEYALLSLVGKIVYFLGSLLNSFMITFVSRDLGSKRSPAATFYTLFAIEAFIALNAFAIFGSLGYITVPALFGSKAEVILPHLPLYAFGIALFTLSSSIVQYRLLRKQYLFPILAIVNTIFLFIGIALDHDSVGSIASTVAISGIFGFMVISLLHLIADQGRYVFRNIIDLFDLFSSVGNEQHGPSKKKILVFNWRDIKHVQAGGAEVYIHELAKRWVRDGCQVTLFCGNDGKCARYELVDGIETVRRGGFYFVYIWAFLYYIFKFRGKYDVIVDCENGIPFFTPLYTKEKQYLVIHHVHRDVFKRSMPEPVAQFAVFLETKFMPYVYENVEIITVSESSKQEIETAGLTRQAIHVVYNGVDLTELYPSEKDSVPTVLYLGRLKQYKSVDVLLKAAQKVLSRVENARIVIAGDGEARRSLEKLAHELGIEKQVSFLGKVTDDMKRTLYQQAWVFVNPSFREGWGITTIEANACQTPVVASKVPGLIDSVQNPHTGYLVSYGDVDEFSMRITELLTDAHKRESMSHAAVEWAKKFSWDVSAQKAYGILFNSESLQEGAAV